MTIFLRKWVYKFIHAIWKLKYPTEKVYELGDRNIANLKVLSSREALIHYLPKQSRGAELGVEYGNFAKFIVEVVNPEILYLVDIWKNRSILTQCEQTLPPSSSIQYVDGDSVHFLEKLEANTLDWVYIDSDHGYETTLNELNAAAKVVKPDGLICGHDYTLISSQGIRRYGVIQAVNQFCMERKYEMVYLTNESHRHLSFALRKLP
ncbi:class I SAM-dependent methyltransferase [bacterium]|nr:class I SAM-dependent methyltransferase [bacterium]